VYDVIEIQAISNLGYGETLSAIKEFLTSDLRCMGNNKSLDNKKIDFQLVFDTLVSHLRETTLIQTSYNGGIGLTAFNRDFILNLFDKPYSKSVSQRLHRFIKNSLVLKPIYSLDRKYLMSDGTATTNIINLNEHNEQTQQEFYVVKKVSIIRNTYYRIEN
jgi:hypothetical protein